jgi:hypothetical protein
MESIIVILLIEYLGHNAIQFTSGRSFSRAICGWQPIGDDD